MNKMHKRWISAMLCIILLAGLIIPNFPSITPNVSAASVATEFYEDYATVSVIKNLGDCPSMQGFDVDGTYLYCAKINTSTETSAIITRTTKSTGETIYMTNAATGTNYFSQIAHANDLAITTINGVKTLFVGTGGAGAGDYSLVRFAINGTKLTEVGHYRVQHNGADTYIAGVKVRSVSDSGVNLVFKRGKYIFEATIPATSTGGIVPLTQICTLDLANSSMNGTAQDFSEYVQQGFGYIDNKIFVPLTANFDTATANISIILVYDIEGASGAVRNDPTLSFRIESTTYADLCEIESCQVDPTDGKLYFNTNRRKTSSDANHDGIHYIQNYIYDPSRGDDASQHYHWKLKNDKLTSVTDDGAIYNNAFQTHGQITNGIYTTSRFHISKSIILEHNKPWILEWKAEGSWTSGSLLFSGNAKGAYEGNRYLYRRQNSTLIALGEYQSGNYMNYGINLEAAGIDGNATHLYALKNHIASDGTNMVYLYVDGKQVGPMNQSYINGTAQGTTSNWVSGKDFTFSYFGSMGHPINNSSVTDIHVWGNGIPDQYEEPNVFRWETQNDTLTSVSGTGLTINTPANLWGSCTNGTYSGYQASLNQQVVLMHDRPWSIEWQNDSWSGTAMLFGSQYNTKSVNVPYVYRSASIISFGNYDGTNYANYGVCFADHGIDPTAAHVYRLTNRIDSTGDNMVYLYVDGIEVGPMNNYFIGSASQGVTSDWISGKDFTFTHICTYQYRLSNPMSYLQVWEGGIPSEYEAKNYLWETKNDVLVNNTASLYAENSAVTLDGTCSNGVFNGEYFAMEKPVVLLHDRIWSIEWKSEGTWKGNTNGALLLSASLGRNQINAPYLYRRSNSDLIALGERRDGYHQNYGIRLSDYGIDATKSHVYKLINRINVDGSNMVYLFVDGVEIGAMNQHFQGGTATNTTSNWISGKDFMFSYIGTPQYPLVNCSMEYLKINEGCTHNYLSKITTAPTCTTSGVMTYTCSLCGDSYTETINPIGHDYSSIVTRPTCTAGGYTTYTCSACGDKYTGNETAATGHNFVNGSCSNCGESCDHSWNQGSCTVCGMACTHNWVNGTCTACGQVCSHKWFGGKCTECNMAYPQKDYYLFGYINGRDYACNDDYLNLGEYKFVNGKLTAIFTENSYVALKSGDNQDWYMSYNYVDAGIAAATLFNTNTGAGEKLFVPGGKIITFTLVSNGDDSFTLSYTARDCTHDSHGQDGICTTCGASVSHSYQTVTNDATCTAAGSKVHTCTVCGYSYCETISATGHSYGSWTQTKAPTCTESGELKRTCSGCGDVQTQSIATTDHSYVDGTCTNCGAADPDAPSVIVPTLNLDHPSLSFEGEIMYNLYFTADDLTSVVEMGLISFNEKLESGTIENADNIYPGYITAGSLYMGQSEGVPARYLGDAVYFKAYAKLSDGSYVYSGMAGYNAAVYAKSILKNSTNDYMKRLVVAMINYGAEAQAYFCGKEGVEYTPMNNFLTANQQALINAYDASMVADLIAVDSNKATLFTYNTGDFTKRSNSVSFDGAFAINYYFTAKGTPDNGMKFYYWNTADYLAADVLTPENATGTMDMVAGSGNQYWSQVSGIAAKEVDQTYFVAGVYELDGVTYTTGILAYSLGKYCAKLAAGTTEQQALSAATAVYGYYAKEYFANI